MIAYFYLQQTVETGNVRKAKCCKLHTSHYSYMYVCHQSCDPAHHKKFFRKEMTVQHSLTHIQKWCNMCSRFSHQGAAPSWQHVWRPCQMALQKSTYVKISPRKTVPIIKCLFYFPPSFRSSFLAQHTIQWHHGPQRFFCLCSWYKLLPKQTVQKCCYV